MPTASASAPRRETTPDHPPYSWMIGEAIDALRGSATEEVISAFIIGRHRGLPQAHDRLLRHYLAKHVGQGLFICTEQGRYSRGGSYGAQVTVAKLSPDHAQEPPDQLALVVANHEDDPPCTATSSAAPVHIPATASSNANIKTKKKPRKRKVQDLYDHNAVQPPRRVLPPCSNVPVNNEAWCVLALPAQLRR